MQQNKIALQIIGNEGDFDIFALPFGRYARGNIRIPHACGIVYITGNKRFTGYIMAYLTRLVKYGVIV